MQAIKRSIFRTDALRRYAQGKDQVVLPHYASPRRLIYLWIALGLLLSSEFVVWHMAGLSAVHLFRHVLGV